MLKKVAIIALVLSLSAVATAGGRQVKNFNRLMQCLIMGFEVKFVVHYVKCDLEVDGILTDEKIDAIGGMSIDVFEFFARGVVNNEESFVVFSESKLIENPIGEGFVFNYVKVKVYESNRVLITAKYLDAITLEEIMGETFHTHIDNGKNDGGVFLFCN